MRASGVFLTLMILPLAAAAQEPAQEDQFFAPQTRTRLVFRWDLLARYDLITHLPRPDVERARLEFRPELALEISDRFRVAVRVAGNLGTDENADNAPNFDNYRSNGVSLDRAFVEARPGPFTVRAGKFAMPLAATEMLWDRDIQPPGAAVAVSLPAGTGTLSLAGAGFVGPQREGDSTRIAAGQLLWRSGPETAGVEASASWWQFEPEDLKEHYIRQNAFVVVGGKRRYASEFRIVDLLVRVRFSAGAVPVLVSLDALRNLEADDGENDAFEGSLALGRLGAPGQWRFFYTYQYVERDAVVGAYTTDDWWFHSNHAGHRGGVAVTIAPSLFVQGAVMVHRRLDLERTLNRFIVDLVKMF